MLSFWMENHLTFVGGVSSLHVSPLQLRSTEAGDRWFGSVGWSWFVGIIILPHVPQVARSRAESLLGPAIDGWLLQAFRFLGLARWAWNFLPTPRRGNSFFHGRSGMNR